MDTDSIFRYKTPNAAKLAACGFAGAGAEMCKTFSLLDGQFRMIVTVAPDGAVRFKVMEPALNEEYVLVHVDRAQGGFVGDVRKACEEVLLGLSAKCFDSQTLKAEQTRRTLKQIQAEFSVEPEFLWDKSPDSAAFRRQDNRKWFAVMMTVERSKIGLDGHGSVEIIDLKGKPQDIAGRLGDRRFLKAYHMNKTHWFTVCLNGSLPDDELFALIAESYRLAE